MRIGGWGGEDSEKNRYTKSLAIGGEKRRKRKKKIIWGER